MTTTPTEVPGSDTERIEQLWAGEFGDAYLDRGTSTPPRVALRSGTTSPGAIPPERARGRMHPGGQPDPPRAPRSRRRASGASTSTPSCSTTSGTTSPASTPCWAWPGTCPSPTTPFDLVVTVGLLIHIPDDTLRRVMGELVRVSSRWVLSGEYHADEPTRSPTAATSTSSSSGTTAPSTRSGSRTCAWPSTAS